MTPPYMGAEHPHNSTINWNLYKLFCHGDGLAQLIVDAVAGVLDGHGQAAAATGDHGDGLAAIAAQGEQKAAQLLVVGGHILDPIFLACLCRC